MKMQVVSLTIDDMYFDEGALEYVEYDASDRELNRDVFFIKLG